MTGPQLELFRKSLLLVLDAAGRQHGLSLEAIMIHCRQFGFTPQREEVDRQLRYLQGEPLAHVELVDKQGFSPEVHNWRITTRGMNFLAENG